jgi:hypothetical protein
VVLGHPFNPPHLVPLVEVAGGRATSAGAVERRWLLPRARQAPDPPPREVRGHVANRLASGAVAGGVPPGRQRRRQRGGRGRRDRARARPALGLLGPFLNLHLSGGAGGIGALFDKPLWQATEAMWRDLGSVSVDADLGRRVADGVAEELAARGGREEVVRRRDEAMLALLRLKAGEARGERGAADLDLPVHGVGEPRPPFATLCAMFDHAVSTAPDTVSLRHLDACRDLPRGGPGGVRAGPAPRVRRRPGEAVALLPAQLDRVPRRLFAALKALAAPALLNPLYPGPQLEPLLRDAAPRAVVCAPETRELVLGLAAVARHPGGGVPGARRDDGGGAGAEPEAPLSRRGAEPVGCRRAAVQRRHHRRAQGGGAHARAAGGRHALHGVQLADAHQRRGLAAHRALHPHLRLPARRPRPGLARATAVIPERFKPEHVVELMAEHRVTVFGGGPPAIYAGVLAAPNLAGADLSALRVCPAGGAPMPVELHERWRRATGREVHEATA